MLSSQDLIDAGRQLEAPFEIELNLAGSVKRVQCVQLLRLVPGRRVVAKMLVDGEVFLGKIFLGSGKSKYCQRERTGIEALQSAGIDTAVIQAEASMGDGGAQVLLLNFLLDVRHLSELVVTNAAEGESYLQRAVGIMAALHSKGLRHTDCHLDNFLISNECLYLVDGDAVQQTAILSSADALENLGLFFVQLPLSLYEQLPRLFDYYNEFCAASKPRDWPAFQGVVQQQRDNRQRRFAKKMFRDCTQFKVAKTCQRFVALDRQAETSELQALIENPDQYIETGKLLKDGNSATVALVELDGQQFVVKRYNIKSFVHWLSRLCRPSRAWLSWRNAQLLQFYGISTPKPLALIERRCGPLRGKAYFITEYVAADDALSYVQKMMGQTAALSNLAEQFTGLFKMLGMLQISHGDFKATNFLWQSGQLTVIDLDSMTLHSSLETWHRELDRDKHRFMKNWGFDTDVSTVMAKAVDSGSGV